jgi:hypothetical protein
VSYKVIINKTGYDDSINNYIPDYNIRTKTFCLYYLETTPSTRTFFSNNIDFTATMYTSGCILISYNDKNSTTTNTMINVYEIYNNTRTLVSSTSNSSTQIINLNVTSINTSRIYLVQLFFNNSISFDQLSPVYRTVYNLVTYTPSYTKPDFNDRINKIVGPPSGDSGGGWSLGAWTTVITASIALLILCVFGPFNAGLSIIAGGVSIVGVQALLNTMFSNVPDGALLISLGVFAIVIGILYMMTKGEGGDKL